MYEYKTVRSKRKTLSVQITESCEIIVKAPYLYSDKKIRKFLEENSDRIDKALEKMSKRKEMKLDLTEDDIKLLKLKAKEILPKKVEYYSVVMGLKPETVKITSAQKRFGSCSSKKHICFSYILMLYPDEAIDYVVVHELSHLVHMNHSNDFYSLVASVLPDYKKREKLLKSKQAMPEI